MDDNAVREFYVKSEDKLKAALDLAKRGIRFDVEGNITRSKETTMKSDTEDTRRSKVGFGDVLLGGMVLAPVAKTELADLDTSKGKGPRVVATTDDDEMSEDDKKQRGVAGKDKAAYEADDKKDETDDEDDVKTKSQPGHRSKVARGVSFSDVLLPDATRHAVKEFDLSDTSRNGKVEPADEGEDALGREYADGVLERLGGGLTGRVGDDGAIPNAGAGPTHVGDTGNAGFKPMPEGEGNRGRVGGEDRGVRAVNPNLGADGAYTREELGQLDAIAVRVGEFTVMAPLDPGISPAGQFKAPTGDASTLKSVAKGIKRGLFSDVIRGPEAGSSNGQQ